MRNQLEAAAALGIEAATVNSSNREDWEETFERIDRGEVDLLLLSPERLANPQFRANVLPELVRTSGLLVIDEAHCISDWGHDFRPDYRRIAGLVKQLPETAAVLCTTATANDRVIGDVTEQLGGGRTRWRRRGRERGGADDDPRHARPALAAARGRRHAEPGRAPGLARHLHSPTSGQRHRLLPDRARHDDGHQLARPATGSRPRPTPARSNPTSGSGSSAMLLGNEIKCVVATSALGMGYDKPDLGFVVHFQGPGSPIAYYQQVGRAGRGLAEADAVLLRGTEDRDVQDFFIKSAFPPAEQVRQGHGAHRRGSVKPLTVGALMNEINLGKGRIGADAQAARGRGRAQQGRQRLGAQRPRVDLRRGADHRRHRRPPRRAEGDGGATATTAAA